MPPELRLQPDRLRSHAITASRLADDLRAALPPRAPGTPVAHAIEAEHERLHAVLLGAVRDLVELSAALAGAAGAAAAADGAVARVMSRIQEELEGGRPAPPSAMQERA